MIKTMSDYEIGMLSYLIPMVLSMILTAYVERDNLDMLDVSLCIIPIVNMFMVFIYMLLILRNFIMQFAGKLEKIKIKFKN